MKEKKLQILNGNDFRSVAFVLLTNGYTVRAEFKRKAPRKPRDLPKNRASLFFHDPKEEKDEKDEIPSVLDDILDDISSETDRLMSHSLRRRVKDLRTPSFRNYPIGLPETKIRGFSKKTIKVQPKLPFKIISLSVPADKMEGLVIEDIKIERRSQFKTPGEIPVGCFDLKATKVRLYGDTAVPGQTIYVTVANRTRKPIVFFGMLLGDVAQ